MADDAHERGRAGPVGHGYEAAGEAPERRKRPAASPAAAASPQRDAREDLAHDPLGGQRRDVGRADHRRDHLDHVRAHQLEPGGHLAAGRQQLEQRHAAGLGRAGARREGRVEHVDVHGQERRSRPDALDRLRHHGLDPALADVVHEEARDAALGLPGEDVLAGPVAAQPDLDVALRRHQARLDELVHRRPVRLAHPEDLGARVRVGVEVDQPDRAVRRARTPARRDRDRVIAAEHDRDRAGGHHLAHRLGDRAVRAHMVGGQHGRVAVVDDAQLRERVDPRLQVRPRRAARGPDGARGEARAGAVGRPRRRWGADDRHVGPLEVARVLRQRRAAEAERPGEVRLLAVAAPALERIDHVRSASRCCRTAARMRVSMNGMRSRSERSSSAGMTSSRMREVARTRRGARVGVPGAPVERRELAEEVPALQLGAPLAADQHLGRPLEDHVQLVSSCPTGATITSPSTASRISPGRLHQAQLVGRQPVEERHERDDRVAAELGRHPRVGDVAVAARGRPADAPRARSQRSRGTPSTRSTASSSVVWFITQRRMAKLAVQPRAGHEPRPLLLERVDERPVAAVELVLVGRVGEAPAQADDPERAAARPARASSLSSIRRRASSAMSSERSIAARNASRPKY